MNGRTTRLGRSESSARVLALLRNATPSLPAFPAGELIVVVGAGVGLAVRLFQLVSRYSVNIFFSDQWDFDNANLFQKHSFWQIFSWQHGPHRQGLGAILAYFLEPYFHWNSRTESFWIAGLIVITALCALWLKIRLLQSLSIFDICIPLIFFTPLQVGEIFIVANWSHGPLPMLLVILYCIAWTVSNCAWRYGLVLVINFAAIYTGFGLFLGLITPFVIVVDYLANVRRVPRGRSYFAVVLSVAIASLGSFFLNYVYNSAVDCQPNLFQSPRSYAKFVCLMFANVIREKGFERPQAIVGAALLLALLFLLARNCIKLFEKGRRYSQYLVGGILISYSVLFSVIAAYGRSCLGFPEAQVSRYVMYLELGLLGAFISLLTLKSRTLRGALLVMSGFILLNANRILPPERFEMQYYRNLKTDWKACYLTYSDIAFCDRSTGHWIYNPGADEALKGRLEYLKNTRQNLYSEVP